MSSHTRGLPWAQLCKHFTFTGTQNDIDTQKADFEVVASSDLNKQIRAFASTFEKHLKQSAQAERRKYRSRAEYAQRAKTWTRSKPRDAEERPIRDQESQAEIKDEVRIRRNREMRALVAKNATPWSEQTEDSFVFTEALGRRAKCDEYFSIDWAFRRIEHWSIPLQRGEERKKADILKLLILSACDPSALPESCQDTHDRLFLLVQHADSGFRASYLLGDDCCYIHQGLLGLLERTLQAYIYLNMLCHWCAGTHDNESDRRASTTITRTTIYTPIRSRWIKDDLFQENRPYVFQPNVDGALIPRPIFMNFRSWSQMIFDLCHQHKYVVENGLFRRYFWSVDDLTEALDQDTPSSALLNLASRADRQVVKAAEEEYFREQMPFRKEQNPLLRDPITTSEKDPAHSRQESAPFFSVTPRTKLFLRHLFRILRLLEILLLESHLFSDERDDTGRQPKKFHWEYAFFEALDRLRFKKNNRLWNDKALWEFMNSMENEDHTHEQNTA